MAMLAGPRQRKRYNLVPKGKALFEDGDRFGTKMLEKMGWSKGKGLGSKENGQQEFIRIRYKNDANGLGYEDRDDQWTEHEKHFNGLLESLHTGESNSNTASGDDGDDSMPRVGFGFQQSSASKEKLKDKFSGQSLEERSKSSKARVHYKKFTKGKDMAQYSEKDLANIFGKKATAEENDFYSQLPSFNAANEASGDDEKKPEFDLGTHTINTGLSVSDYFKMKMDAIKNKKKTEEKNEEAGTIGNGEENIAEEPEVIDVTNDSEDESERSRKKKKKSKKQKTEEVPDEENGRLVNIDLTDGVCENDEEQADQQKGKKKKNKKVGIEANCDEVVVLDDESSEDQRPKKKKKKKSQEDLTSEEASEESKIAEKTGSKLSSQVDEEGPSIPSKKKKSKKHATENTEADLEVVSIESATDELPPKKEKKSKKRKAEESVESLEQSETNQTDIPMKKKKSKPSSEEEVNIKEPSEIPQKKKKKNKQTPPEVIEETPIESDVLTENNQSTKSKKKNKTKTTDNTDTTDSNQQTSKVSPQHELTDCYLDTYKISTFCAEKFRNVDLTAFRGSNISELNGYGFNENLQLQVVNIDGDKERITKLWTGNKYKNALPKGKIYHKFMSEVRKARTQRKRIPKLKVKPLHSLSVFQSL